METMKAYVCSRYGGPEVLRLEECRKPVPADGEVLIRVGATSVTNSDIFIRSSRVQPSMMIPFRLMIGITGPRRKIIGQVFAGEVAGKGSRVSGLSIGDRVYGLTGFSLGAYGEFLTLREKASKQGCVARMPRTLGFEEATWAAYGGLLALQSLEKLTLRKGDRVLLYGAAGTSGTFALQYLKTLGAEVTCVCREDKFEVLRSLGADKLIDYTRKDAPEALESYSAVLDCVGRAKTSELKLRSKEHVADPKSWLSIDDEALVLSSQRLDRITALAESGKIRAVNDRVYRFDQMAEAHRYVEAGRKTGNVAVTVRPEEEL